MYHPSRDIGEPEKYGLNHINDTFIESLDGVRIQVWQRTAQPGYPTIMYFHGNADNLGDRAAKFSAFIDNGFGLVAVEYRGFGKSEGTPTESGIYRDAQAAINYALIDLKIPQEELIYFGESLGSGVAVQMAVKRPPALLVLEAAYTSVETRSAELYPFIIGVRQLVLDKYDSIAKIKKITCPLLMLHGTKDLTIPLRHGQRLFDAASEPKRLVVYEDVHHADYTPEQIITPLIEEAQKLGLIKTSAS